MLGLPTTIKISLYLLIPLLYLGSSEAEEYWASSKLAVLEETGPLPFAFQSFIINDFKKDACTISSFGKALPFTEVVDSPFQGGKALWVRLPATGLRGGHGVKITCQIILKDADWSAYDGIEIWINYPENGPLDRGLGSDGEQLKFTIKLKDASGRVYASGVKALPHQGGAWQPLRLPITPNWKMFSLPGQRLSSKEGIQWPTIRELSVETGAHKNVSLDFAIGSVVLYKENKGVSSLSFQSKDGLFMKRPGEDFVFSIRVDGVQEVGKSELLFELKDFWGRTAFSVTEPLQGMPGGGYVIREIPFHVQDQGYWSASAVLKVDGKTVYRAFRGAGSLAPLTQEQDKLKGTSPFGIWPGFDNVLGAGWKRRAIGVDHKVIEPSWFKTPFNTVAWVVEPEWPQNKKFERYEGYSQWLERLSESVRNSITVKPISYYEVINEPNAHYWGPMERLVQYHCDIRNAIKKGDPSAKVGGPCPYDVNVDFIKSFLEAGGDKCIDFVDVHGYMDDKRFLPALIGLKALMKEYGLERSDILITEKGLSLPSVTPEEQAVGLVRGYVLAISAGVKLLVWHAYFKDIIETGVRPVNNNNNDFYIARADRTPNPAYIAYGVMTRMLLGAKFERSVEELPKSSAGYEFSLEGEKKVQVLWKKDPGFLEVPVNMNGTPSSYVDIMGGIHSLIGKTSVTISPDPIYLVFEKTKK